MARMIKIEKSMTYNLDEIMEMNKCNYEQAIEIAWDYFDEEGTREEITETDDF